MAGRVSYLYVLFNSVILQPIFMLAGSSVVASRTSTLKYASSNPLAISFYL